MSAEDLKQRVLARIKAKTRRDGVPGLHGTIVDPKNPQNQSADKNKIITA